MTTILILSVIGIVAILAELVLPGGVLGVLGVGCLIGAVGVTFVEYGALAGFGATIALIVFGFATLGFWMKFFHKLPFTRRLILNNESGKDTKREADQELIGKTGITLTDLTPSGFARFGDQKIDVMTEAGSIPKGATVEVTATRGPTILVREVTPSREDLPS
tara:strand:+ start:942 stop:1430 length:489 start_codon:yes stop_codon:yes gene_type:complete